MSISDWSSDVCSSDLADPVHQLHLRQPAAAVRPGPARTRRRTDDRRLGPGRGGGGGVRRAQRRAGGCRGGVARATVLNPLPVGWVERSETHRLPGNQGTMGFAALRSEEHTSELLSLMSISYAVLSLHNKKTQS